MVNLSAQLLKPMTLWWFLGFWKICLESWHLWLGSNKMFELFLWMFSHLLFHLELFSTHMTSITLCMCVFMCKKYLKQFHVNCVGNMSRKRKENTIHMQKKHKLIFFYPSQRYPDSKHLFQNPNIRLIWIFDLRHIMLTEQCVLIYT